MMAATCNLACMPCSFQSPASGICRRDVGKQLKMLRGTLVWKDSSLRSGELNVRTRGVIPITRGTQKAERLSASCGMDVPDFLPAMWTASNTTKPLGPTFDLTAEGAILRQLDALQSNDQPYPDHGVEVMYRFTAFDPFRRSSYFGPPFDLGQFERFRRIFHHSTYRVLLGHSDREILSSLFLDEHCFKQRVWINGSRPGEEEIFEFTLVQRVGGNWDGYWFTDSIRHDGEGITGSIAY